MFVSSFLVESIRALREVAPQVPSGLLVDWRTEARGALEKAVHLGCTTFHPFVTQVDAGLVDAATSDGVGLHVWTVNADTDLAAMGALGVEAVITDRVPVAIRILRSGGRDVCAAVPTARNGGERAG